jgi:hypothetical protein
MPAAGEAEGQGASRAPAEGGNGPMPRSGWKPSFGFKVGIAGLMFFTAVLIVAGLAGAQQGSTVSDTPTPSPEATPNEPDNDGSPRRPRDHFASSVSGTDTADQPGASTGRNASNDDSADDSEAPAGQVEPTIGEPAIATPAAEFSSALVPAAHNLVTEIEGIYAVDVVEKGQYWGDDEAAQVRNLSYLQDALAALPPAIVQDVTDSPGGTLTFLSNEYGRTLGGWQPYGHRAANYYTNQDTTADVSKAANQVVLQPGSSAQTIAHEIIHGYQLRNSAPGAFVSVFLTDEMKSFMSATGWTQLVSDTELSGSGSTSWDDINDSFAYTGTSLEYNLVSGGVASLYGPNPLEAFAEAAALYYTHGAELPAWDAYWQWFEANLG